MQRKSWREVADLFLQTWRDKEEVVGSLVTGSYVLATQTGESDIDIQIILDAECTWKERGNAMLEGYLIEYFAAPTPLVHQLFQADYADNQRTTARMFATGEVMFDKDGQLAALQQAARQEMGKPFASHSPEFVEERKYWLWDSMDNLSAVCAAGTPDRGLIYYAHLALVLNLYCVFLKCEMPHLAKTYKLFTVPDFGEKYEFEIMPDKKFIQLFLRSLGAAPGDHQASAQELTNHVLMEMGGFDIRSWELRTSGRTIDAKPEH